MRINGNTKANPTELPGGSYFNTDKADPKASIPVISQEIMELYTLL